MKQLIRLTRQHLRPAPFSSSFWSIQNLLQMQHRHVEVVQVAPRLVLGLHDVDLGVVEVARLAALDLCHGLLCGVAEAAVCAGEEGEAQVLGEEAGCVHCWDWGFVDIVCMYCVVYVVVFVDGGC